MACHINFKCQEHARSNTEQTLISCETGRSFLYSFPSSEVFITDFHVTTLLNSKDRRKAHPSQFTLVSNGNYLRLLCNFPSPFLKKRVTANELTGPGSDLTCEVIINKIEKKKKKDNRHKSVTIWIAAQQNLNYSNLAVRIMQNRFN